MESPTSPFQAEFRGGENLANLAPRRRLTQQNEASGPVGRYVKLIVDNYLHFSEMIVYPPGNVDSNVAAGKTVTASGVGFGGTLTGLVDGDIRGATAASSGSLLASVNTVAWLRARADQPTGPAASCSGVCSDGWRALTASWPGLRRGLRRS